ncbi:hypothetical protein B6D29_01875 [Microgenomates bacterium UTCPR1]|nr:MAG: hypothetical protein B6D29_01875 [Microgenomates bacterium UTCPR1]
MRHNVKKIKFNSGKDANRSLVRKLAVNFLDNGYLQTTLPKAKVLKTFIERMVTKMKVRSESNKNFLLKHLGSVKVVKDGFERVGPALVKIQGGYVRIVKIGTRTNDGSLVARVEWSYPVVKEIVKKTVKKVKQEKAKEVEKK